MAPVDSGIVVSHSGTTYGGGRGVRIVNGKADKRRETGRSPSGHRGEDWNSRVPRGG